MLITRILSPEDAGIYFWIISFISILVPLSVFGLNIQVLKNLSIYYESRDNDSSTRLISSSLLLSIRNSIYIVIVVAPAFYLLNRDLDLAAADPKILAVALLSLPFLAVTNIISHGIQAYRKVFSSMFLAAGVLQLFIVALLLIVNNIHLTTVIIFYVLSSILATILAILLLVRTVGLRAGTLKASIEKSRKEKKGIITQRSY